MLKLLRLATIYLSPEPQDIGSWKLECEHASVYTHLIGKQPLESGKKRLLVHAECLLDEFPNFDSAGRVLVPEIPRRHCEEAIEIAGDLLSVLSRCRRNIASPFPWVAFVSDSPDMVAKLKASKGINATARSVPSVRFSTPPEASVLEGLADRFDGVVLLAESYTHDNAIGRYRELVRFLELAFARPATQLGKKLHQFLSGASFGYTRDEVESWLSLRNASMHGDKGRTARLPIEADARPIIDRLEQAAVDVLFNKRNWHNPSQERRKIWKPIAGTTSVTGELSIVQGSQVGLVLQLLDGFGIYPCDLSANIDSPPAEWWCTIAPTENI